MSLVRKILPLLLLLLPLVAEASGTITGVLTTPNVSTPIRGASITLTLSQTGVDVTQTYALTTSPVGCGTNNAGSVVGIPDPQVLPRVSAVTLGGGGLAGLYYVKIAYYNVDGTQTTVSPEGFISVVGPNNALEIQPPLVQPARATGFKVYVGTISGGETLQAVSGGWVNTDVLSLVSGASPTANTTVCSLTFNDSIIPTNTRYRVNIVDGNGKQIAGYPKTWNLFGSSVSIAQLFDSPGQVSYPLPILATPLSNFATQSINGPLTLNGFTLTAGALDLPNNVTPPATKAGHTVMYTDSMGQLQVCLNGGVCSTFSGQWLKSGNLIYAGTTTDRVAVGFTTAGDFSGSSYDSSLIVKNQLIAVNGVDVNSSALAIGYDGGSNSMLLNSTKTGSASYLPLTVKVDNLEALRVDVNSGNPRLLVGLASTDNSNTSPGAVLAKSQIAVVSATTDASILSLAVAGGNGHVSSGKTGSGSYLNMHFDVGGIEPSMVLDINSGNPRLLVGLASTDNANSSPGAVLSGSQVAVVSATTNASVLSMAIAGGAANIASGVTGSGSQLNIKFFRGATEVMDMDGTTGGTLVPLLMNFNGVMTRVSVGSCTVASGTHNCLYFN